MKSQLYLCSRNYAIIFVLYRKYPKGTIRCDNEECLKWMKNCYFNSPMSTEGEGPSVTVSVKSGTSTLEKTTKRIADKPGISTLEKTSVPLTFFFKLQELQHLLKNDFLLTIYSLATHQIASLGPESDNDIGTGNLPSASPLIYLTEITILFGIYTKTFWIK